MKKERKETKLESEMISAAFTFLLKNSKELGLDICDNCACSSSANTYKIACEVSTMLYDFLKNKNILKD